MRLRQKLFAAIIAAMAVMFMFLALASFMNALEAGRARASLEARLEAAVVRRFREAVASEDEDRWDRLKEQLDELGVAECALAREDEAPGDAGWASRHVEAAREGGVVFYLPRKAGGLETVSWLSGIFWAVAGGTAVLLLVVYGLLLRLVLRPVEDLVAASRVLSSGGRPPKVVGAARTDEMGELVGAFNSMTAEVVASREELERRVEAAVAGREKAQRRLALEQRLSATGKLAAGVAHEIANPLGGMMNAARAVAKEPGLSERGREYVGLVNDGLERVRAIVERMRTFVRPRPAVGPVDVAGAVRGALAFARHRIEGEGIVLEESYPPEPVRVAGDAGELQQVFLNLVVNALDAMKGAAEGGRRLGVRVAREGAGVVAEVSDTGVGMDAAALASAFDLFYSTKDEDGTGLGLAVAHRIVTDHGGEIELQSSPGKGTTARVSLPAESHGEGAG